MPTVAPVSSLPCVSPYSVVLFMGKLTNGIAPPVTWGFLGEAKLPQNLILLAWW
jgi:hypothetical protein